MAAADLRHRPLLVALGAVWAATFGAALLVAAIPGASHLAGAWFAAELSPRGNPPPSIGRALSLIAHNARVLCFPFLLAAARIGRGRARPAIDVLVACDVAIQAGLVGAALGAYGTRILPYLPHLVFEWLGLATALAVWLIARRRAVTARELTALAATFVAALVVAGVLETYAAPHR